MNSDSTAAFVGDYQHPEMRWALRGIKPAVSVEEAELVIACHSRPGMLPLSLLDEGRKNSPKKEIVSLVGSWCEGELRTGQPWPNVPRVFWYDFRRWWNARCVEGLSSPGAVLVAADDYDSGASLVGALAAEGHAAFWAPDRGPLPLARGVQAGVWIGGQLNGYAAQQLAKFQTELQARGARTIALLDFPRLDEVQACEALGVSAVFGKPWDAVALSRAIRTRTWRAAVRELALA
jgi:hypothetical protein